MLACFRGGAFNLQLPRCDCQRPLRDTFRIDMLEKSRKKSKVCRAEQTERSGFVG
jgi:hypothetical protein